MLSLDVSQPPDSPTTTVLISVYSFLLVDSEIDAEDAIDKVREQSLNLPSSRLEQHLCHS